MEAYKLWVRKHREFVHSLESLANGITWLLPERFSNSEIGPEAVYAILGIVSTVNQHIIDTTPVKRWPPPLEEQASSFPWSLCVSIIKDAETVVEVASEYFVGEPRKWNYLAVTEALKAFVRLAAFRDSGYRPLLQGGETVNNGVELPEDSRVHHRGIGNSGRPGGSNGPADYISDNYGNLPRGLEGRARSALSRFGQNAKMTSDPAWLNRLWQQPEVPVPSIEKPTFATLWFQKGVFGRLIFIGEVLSILRPLIYVLFIRRYGIQSWKPWLISLVVDLTGMSILSSGVTHNRRTDDKYYQLSVSEKDELKRRKLVWALYIMRDPFFTTYTKHHLHKADNAMSQIPLVGFVTGKLIELIVGAQTRYTYTSGS